MMRSVAICAASLTLLPAAARAGETVDPAVLTVELRRGLADDLFWADKQAVLDCTEDKALRSRLEAEFNGAQRAIDSSAVERAADGSWRILFGMPDGRRLVARAHLPDGEAAGKAVAEALPRIEMKIESSLPMLAKVSATRSWSMGDGFDYSEQPGETLASFRHHLEEFLAKRPTPSNPEDALAEEFFRRGDAQGVALAVISEGVKVAAGNLHARLGSLRDKAGVKLSDEELQAFLAEEWTVGQGNVSRNAESCAPDYRAGDDASIDPCVIRTLKAWAAARKR